METLHRVKNASICDAFWSRRLETVRAQMIPYEWEALCDRLPDAEPSHCIHNFRVAAGLEAGGFEGCVFQDSDLAKWIEAASYSLMRRPDPALEKTLGEAVDLIVAAQQADGYMDTYYIINGLERRFTNTMDHHELYCAGHMIEAAVAHHEATGSRRLLDAVCRLADCIGRMFGAGEGQLHGYPGHEIIEMALVRLYGATEERRYLELAEYFVNQRGQRPNFFEEEMAQHGNSCHWSGGPLGLQYYQAGKPVREQQDAEGHAVRAMYFYSGLADVARLTGDAGLLAACDRLWESVARRRMYITGGIGSSAYGEAFTFDCDLPNDTAYAETCACVGLIFFARRMLEIRRRGEYADVMERALYNGVLSGMSLDGRSFFYVNPLEVFPEACRKDELRRHVEPVRRKWFGCACCPPNLARLLASLDTYAWSADDAGVAVHLYTGGTFEAAPGGAPASFSVETDYPWNGSVCIRLKGAGTAPFALSARIPGWCRRYTARLNGELVLEEPAGGYLTIERAWRAGDTLELDFSMPVELIEADPAVRADIGKAAVMRGPVVYCLEEADNGRDLHRLRLREGAAFAAGWDADLLGGVVKLTCAGERLQDAAPGGGLYRFAGERTYEPVELTWIPYYAWANRGEGEMTVWLRR